MNIALNRFFHEDSLIRNLGYRDRGVFPLRSLFSKTEQTGTVASTIILFVKDSHFIKLIGVNIFEKDYSGRIGPPKHSLL